MGYAKPTAARLVDQRARRRAQQQLIANHRDEYRDLYEWHRRNATTEADLLASTAAKSHHHQTSEPPRLMSGRYKPNQNSTDRIDVARCPHCVTHHDRGHVCEVCGARPHEPVTLPAPGVRSEPMPDPVEDDWRTQALCAQTDPESWFPEKGGTSRTAKSVCEGCPVTEPCLKWALDNDERFGVWGGLSERERSPLHRERDKTRSEAS